MSMPSLSEVSFTKEDLEEFDRDELIELFMLLDLTPMNENTLPDLAKRSNKYGRFVTKYAFVKMMHQLSKES